MKRANRTEIVPTLLGRNGGATLEDLVAATGWPPHTARAAMTGLRKKGQQIAPTRVDGGSRYNIVRSAISWVDVELQALASLSPAQLRERWRGLEASRPLRPLSFRRLLLAQRLQERRSGALSALALSCLAPDIVTAIVEGRQPVQLTTNLFMDGALPLSRVEQRVARGFS